MNFICLAMTPTALIGLNEDLKVPKNFKFVSMAKPSHFAYPEFLKKEEAKAKDKVETAVLSTTTKVKRKAKDKTEGTGRETPNPAKEEVKAPDDATMDGDKDEEKKR